MDTHFEMLEDAISISALQHYSYCPRQCALIHIEQTFDENLYTLRGHAVHEQVDTPDSHLVGGIRVERSLPLYSHRLGLVGFSTGQILTHFKMDICERLSHRMHHSTAMTT